MKRTAFVHIRLPKTGTKTLQWRLFAAHPEIYCLGRFDGPAYRATYRRFDCCRDAAVQMPRLKFMLAERLAQPRYGQDTKRSRTFSRSRGKR